MPFHHRPMTAVLIAHTLSKWHVWAVATCPIFIGWIFCNFTMSWHFYAFSSSFQKWNLKPWGLGMLWIFQQVSNAIWEVLQKSSLKNSNYFTSWTILPLVHLTVQLKFDLLHWPFLMKSNYAPWKYMSNGVFAYKELAIWTIHVEVMPSWLRVIFEIHWTITCQPYMGFSSSWTFWKG